MARLRVTDGGMAFDVYLDDKLKVMVGRDDACDVLIEDGDASRNHCRIELTPAGFLLTDLESSNGTTVNGRAVTTHPMRDGDEIGIGECRIKFHDPDEAERLAAAGLAAGAPAEDAPADEAPAKRADGKKRSGRRRAAGSGRNVTRRRRR